MAIATINTFNSKIPKNQLAGELQRTLAFMVLRLAVFGLAGALRPLEYHNQRARLRHAGHA